VISVEAKSILEKEFLLRSCNKKYSIEYLYSINKTGKKLLTIYFLPNTAAYSRYGFSILVDLYLTETERIYNTYLSKPPIRTYGIIKAQTSFLSIFPQQEKDLIEIGFNTADIGINNVLTRNPTYYKDFGLLITFQVLSLPIKNPLLR